MVMMFEYIPKITSRRMFMSLRLASVFVSTWIRLRLMITADSTIESYVKFEA